MKIWRTLHDPQLEREVTAFVDERVIPVAGEIDAQDVYPVEIIEAAAAAGYNTLTLPTQYGGGGRSNQDALLVMEAIAYGSAAVAISMITIYQSQTIIERYGEPSLKERFLPQYAGGLRAAYALTEAAHGSDIRSLDTKALRTDTGWVIRGEKAFITSGSAAQLFVVLAETEIGVSAFAVPFDTPGVSTYVGPNATTFGLRNGPHVNLVLDDVEVPADHLIGEEGKGMRQAVITLAHSRTLAAGISLGIGRAAVDASLAFAGSRKAFDQTVLEFQGIQWYFADIVTALDAARLLTYQAARDLDAGHEIARYTSEAKLMASEVATRAASTAVSVCGARGTMESAPFGRFLRDAKAYEIAGGSTEVLKNTIAKSLLKAVSG
ncbi:MAG: putative acyl-CoA dehydrogenase [Frankiales bacterium]|nr:putative acyl-CoA dehydrogenase [Frankiales bacterium]